MVYRNYPYSFKATFLSVLINFGALAAAAGALISFSAIENKVVGVLLAILFAALAVFLFVYVGRILLDKLAEKWSAENIRTKVGIAFQYVYAHPEEYERVCAENPKFAEHYVINEKGRCVKRK